jgi:hypothetical protein
MCLGDIGDAVSENGDSTVSGRESDRGAETFVFSSMPGIFPQNTGQCYSWDCGI